MANFSIWSLADSLTVTQAASLWCGVDPANHKIVLSAELRGQVTAIEQALTASIVAGTLPANAELNALRIIGDHSTTLVSRDALRKWALSKQQRPAFLFDTMLSAASEPATNPSHRMHDLDANPTNKGGRPAEYDWDAFIFEIIRIADLDGLPEKQSELVGIMLQWFEDKFGAQPAESSVKQRISKIYNGLGRGRKPVEV